MNIGSRDIEQDDERVLVRFYNHTQYSLKLTWHRSDGLNFSYGILSPKTYVTVSSYSGHVWTLINNLGEYMIPHKCLPDNHIEEQFYIVPKVCSEVSLNHVHIFNRMRSLFYLSAKKVAQEKIQHDFLPTFAKEAVDYFIKSHVDENEFNTTPNMKIEKIKRPPILEWR